MRVRYSGPDEARNLAFPGGCIVCPRKEWVDVEAAAKEAAVPVSHLEVVVRGLDGQDGWEIDDKPKGRKATTPAVPDEEQS